MMGGHAKQNELWVEPVNLARRIPEDYPLKKLRNVLQLDFVRQEVSRFYGSNGNVSIDPVIIMKMMLLLFWDNVPSERELFGNLLEAQIILEQWRNEYNDKRPHSSLGYKTPSEYARSASDIGLQSASGLLASNIAKTRNQTNYKPVEL